MMKNKKKKERIILKRSFSAEFSRKFVKFAEKYGGLKETLKLLEF